MRLFLGNILMPIAPPGSNILERVRFRSCTNRGWRGNGSLLLRNQTVLRHANSQGATDLNGRSPKGNRESAPAKTG